MTKLGIISAYQRIIYNSAVKRDFYTSSFHLSSASSGGKDPAQPVDDKNVKSTDDKAFNFKTGEIGLGQKNDLLKNLNIEEAKKLALHHYDNQKKLLEDKIDSVRVIFGSKPPRNAEEEWYYKRVSFWMKKYEDVVGLTEVKAAQARVVECERRFVETQDLRRESQAKITDIQKKIKVTTLSRIRLSLMSSQALFFSLSVYFFKLFHVKGGTWDPLH